MLGALLHTLFNSFGKIALFFMAGRINRDLQTREINSVQGLMTRLPWSGFAFGLAFFYIVGTPPSGIFFSELLMLQGMVHARKWVRDVQSLHDFDERWTAEEPLRQACEVGATELDYLASLSRPRRAELKKKLQL